MILDGKALAAEARAEVARGVEALKRERGTTPGLAAVRVGEDVGSAIYVRNKRKACEEVGMRSWEHHLPETVSQEALLALVAQLNADPAVHGILVQLPHPKQIDSDAVIAAVDPRKDADGFHPLNAGALFTGRPGPRPCTPAGIMRLLDRAGVRLQGARALVVGRSNIVGKPVAMMLLERHATVTVAHSRTADLAAEVARADVVVAATGKPGLVKGAWIKEGATVIDVGIHRGADGKIAGDVEFEEASRRAAWITPVPGGVGPMTIAMLLSNTLELARRAAS